MKKTMKTLATLLITGFAFTACTGDEMIEEVMTQNPLKTYTLSVDVVGSETRALMEENGGLNATWETTDKVSVFLEGTEVGVLFPEAAGTTAKLSGKVTGHIESGDRLTLKFGNQDYMNQDGTLTSIDKNCNYSEAVITVSSIAGDVINAEKAAVFENMQSIVKFKLQTTDDGLFYNDIFKYNKILNINILREDGEIVASVNRAESTPNAEIYVSVPAPTGNFTNNIVEILYRGPEERDLTFYQECVSSAMEPGRFYKNELRLPSLGDLMNSDGTFSSLKVVGKTPIGVIAYLGKDVYTENGVKLRDGETTLNSHGLLLCLKNAGGNDLKWKIDITSDLSDYPANEYLSDTEGLFRNTGVSGYGATKAIAETANAQTAYPVIHTAWNYTELAAPATTTGWFLPSIQQWVKMMQGLGGLKQSDIHYGKPFFDNDHTGVDKWEAALKKAGTGNYDSMTESYIRYWSVTETSSSWVAQLFVDATEEDEYEYTGFGILRDQKNIVREYYRVRTALAF